MIPRRLPRKKVRFSQLESLRDGCSDRYASSKAKSFKPSHVLQFYLSNDFSQLRAKPSHGAIFRCYSPVEKSCSPAEKQPFRGRVPIQSSRDTRSSPNAGATFSGCHSGLHSTLSGDKELLAAPASTPGSLISSRN